MPTYKLTYFNVTGAAEPIRYILAHANEKFEDVRVPTDNWPEQKKEYTLGKLPIFEIDGKPYIQSVAIARHLAKKYKLTGRNDIEDMLMDAAVDTVCDMRTACARYFWEQNPEVKKTLLAPLQNEILPNYLNYIDKLIKDNRGYLVNGNLSWADLYLAASAPYMLHSCEMNFLKDYSNINALIEKVNNLPKIKNYLSTVKPLF